MISAPALLPLLGHLAAASPAEGRHGSWRYQRVAGGANNLVYRATSPTHDLAIKWAIRDPRDRAGREYAALVALRAAGLGLAPAPLLLDRERYPQPVVVQSWLPGPVLPAPPAADEWAMLLGHYLAVHAITPERAGQPLQAAVLTMRSAEDGLTRIDQQLAGIPAAEHPPELMALVARAARRRWETWPAPPLALCRVDCNPTNFIRRPGAWASVDWENSGWGDPAFELADMRAHPAYAAVPAARWGWLLAEYATASGDAGVARRARVYYQLMLVWWAARFARTLYEVPRGGDQRLAGRPSNWQAASEAGYQRYSALAHAEFDRLS